MRENSRHSDVLFPAYILSGRISANSGNQTLTGYKAGDMLPLHFIELLSRTAQPPLSFLGNRASFHCHCHCHCHRVTDSHRHNPASIHISMKTMTNRRPSMAYGAFQVATTAAAAVALLLASVHAAPSSRDTLVWSDEFDFLDFSKWKVDNRYEFVSFQVRFARQHSCLLP